jgi:hypothetical protein
MEQFLIKTSKLLRRNGMIARLLFFEHAPKPCRLVFQHVWSFSSKLQTCFKAYFKVCFICRNTAWIMPTVYSLRLCHLPFCVSALFREPGCKCLPPFIGISRRCGGDFPYYPCLDRLLQYEGFYRRCSVRIATCLI